MYEVNERFFEVWSQEMAYIFGYVFCKAKIIDNEIAIHGNNETLLHLSSKLCQRHLTNRGGTDMLIFSSRAMVESLKIKNIFGRIDNRLVPQVPADFFLAFIKGVYLACGQVTIKENKPHLFFHHRNINLLSYLKLAVLDNHGYVSETQKFLTTKGGLIISAFCEKFLGKDSSEFTLLQNHYTTLEATATEKREKVTRQHNDDERQICLLYTQGKYVPDIAKQFNKQAKTIYDTLKRFNIPKRRKYNDFSGQVFDLLTVISYTHSNDEKDGPKWLCQCICGEKVIRRTSSLRKGQALSCRKCKQKRQIKSSITGKPMKVSMPLHGEIYSSFWNQIHHSARSRNLQFEIVPATIWQIFEKQSCCCDYCGKGLILPRKHSEHSLPDVASLDRIDSKVGYTKDNVHWVCKNCQWLKSSFIETEFLEQCFKITDYRRSQLRLAA